MSSSSPARAPGLDLAAVNPLDPCGHEFHSAESSGILHFHSFEVGKTYYGTQRFVEYVPGNLPIIISAPHGGYAAPEHIPDRKEGIHEPDIQSQELSRMLAEAFSSASSPPSSSSGAASSSSASSPAAVVLRPHLVLNLLRRGRLDLNRNEQAASGGHPETRLAWRQFHAFIRRAKREIARGRSATNPQWRQAHNGNASSAASAASALSAAQFPHRGLFVDLHGQSYDRRHQLGYVLNQADLSSHSDEQLDASRELRDKCSLRAAVNARVASASLSSLVRGAYSLGSLLEKLGHVCIPSPTSPHSGPGEKPIMYFNGGYNTCVHGSSVLGTQQREKEAAEAMAAESSSAAVADPDPAFTSLFSSELEANNFLGIQVESAFENNRDSTQNMQRFANNLAKALTQFAQWHVLREGDSWPGAQAAASSGDS